MKILKNHLIKNNKLFKKNNITFYWNYKYNLKKSLSKANSKNAKYVIIIGEDEFKNDTLYIKKLSTGRTI